MIKQKTIIVVSALAVFSVIFTSFFASAKSYFYDEKWQEDKAPIANDALVAPDKINFLKGIGGAPSVGRAPYGAGFYDTSEYMVGSVSVAVILPESTGCFGCDSSTENWTATQESNISSEVQNAFNWWDEKNSHAKLSFNYHFYPGRTDTRAQTSREPINGPSYTIPGIGQGLWIAEIMSNFGYSTGDYFYRTRSFLDNMRNADGTDWAFMVFVANDQNSATRAFTDSTFAFAYYGGPFTIMTYNNKDYGIENMDAVLTHEMGHIFYALDQYSSAQKDCALRLGYQNYENQNSEYNVSGGQCKTNVDSIMRGGIYPYTSKNIDKYAKGQIGWGDTNSNSIPDAVDVTPKITITSYDAIATGRRYYGTMYITPKTNKNSYYDTLNDSYAYPQNNIYVGSLTAARFRIAEGNWKNVTISDGALDSLSESFYFDVAEEDVKSYLEINATTTNGNSKTVTPSGATGKRNIVVGAGFNYAPQVKVLTSTGKVKKSFYAYSKSMLEGVKVASCDFEGDGKDEIVTIPAYNWKSGEKPLVKIFSKNGKLKKKFKVSVKNSGISLACGDTNGDGKAEIILGAGYDDQPWVRILTKGGKLVKKFLAFDKKFIGSVSVAAGDIDADNKDEIVVGAGWGGGPQVRFFERNGKAKKSTFMAYSTKYRDGLRVAVGNIDSGAKEEIGVLPFGYGTAKNVKIFRYGKSKSVRSFMAYPKTYKYEAEIAMGDVNGDGKAEVVTSMGMDNGMQVKVLNAKGKVIKKIYPFGKNFRSGAYLATGRLN